MNQDGHEELSAQKRSDDHRTRRRAERQSVIMTVRALSGLSGDMTLCALASLAELTQREVNALVSELKLPALEGVLAIEPRSVNRIAGVGCRIDLPREHTHRSLSDIRKIIAGSAMPAGAKELSERAFVVLAEAEASAHGKKVEEIVFHEVGALDSILDICLSCRIFAVLAADRFACSPLPLADGVIDCAHGKLLSPAPAVLRMLTETPVRGFAGEGETVTPTALALLKAFNAEFGGWPSMIVEKTTISYGGRIFENAPNGAIWALGRSL
ncbi:MAG: LarC family nickel insertion protein [Helicobacteraceae bacterium]|jgi:uncharacterized protein (DUF111 family)|nr:LarC family nickel insertion protein [Helicobacteraceae bacterium]